MISSHSAALKGAAFDGLQTSMTSQRRLERQSLQIESIAALRF